MFIRVPEPLRAFRLPPLLLQPIVENAVKHGIAPARRGGDLVVEARLDQSNGAAARLVVAVRDSGAGASEAELKRGRTAGVGLNNVARRLTLQYGAAAEFGIRSTPGVGTIVELSLPAEPAEAREPATVWSAR